MLELPECRTIAEQMREVLVGKTVVSAAANTTPHGFAWYFGDPALYDQRIRGLQVDQVTSHGGLVEIVAEHMRLLLNDGVNARYLEPGKPLPKKHQLLLELDDGSHLVCTVQMYGGMSLFAEGENDDNRYYLLAKEKPDPLSDAFDQAYFDSLLQQSKPTLSAKAFLATEQRIPGLGNGVLQDILFQARIHPKTKLSALPDARRETMFRSVKQVLADMTAAGGRDTEKDLYGNPGGYRSILSRNTVKFPCRVCGDSLIRQAYLGGNIYFCPSCQPQS